MNRRDESGFGAYPYDEAREKPPLTADPTFVSLPRSELRRLLDIETAALAAYQEMSGIQIERRTFVEVTKALDAALHMPVFGG